MATTHYRVEGGLRPRVCRRQSSVVVAARCVLLSHESAEMYITIESQTDVSQSST